MSLFESPWEGTTRPAVPHTVALAWSQGKDVSGVVRTVLV